MTWEVLLNRQIAAIDNRACKEFIEGYQAFDGLLDSFPDIEKLSNQLEKMTGWRAVPVSGLLEYNKYFQHLANKIFPVANFIRDIEHLDYIPEPDAWHDIFGHLPLLTNSIYSRFVATLSRQIVLANDVQRQHLNNLYWYTVEVGLCQENNQCKAYGAALISSFHEIQYALSDKPNIHPLDLGIVSKLTVKIDEIQNNLYEIPFFDFLEDLTEKIDKLIIPPLPLLKSY